MADDIDAHLGRRLRRRRRLVGLTQEQLASAVGVRFQQIQKYECGANRISAARLWSLAEALQSPIGYFYDGLPSCARPAAARAEPAELAPQNEAFAACRPLSRLPERGRRPRFEAPRPQSSETSA